MSELFDVTYAAAEDALYAYLVSEIPPGSAVRQVIAEAVPDRGEVILDFDSHGVLLGIEVLGASTLVSPELIAAAATE